MEEKREWTIHEVVKLLDEGARLLKQIETDFIKVSARYLRLSRRRPLSSVERVQIALALYARKKEIDMGDVNNI